MLTTNVEPLNAAIEKAHAWIKDLKEAGPFSDDHDAYIALRAVLHVLRDRLVVDEAAQLAAQMPLIVRGIYYEGWNPSRPTKLRNRKQFALAVEEGLPPSGRIQAEAAVRAVFGLLQRRVNAGELEDIRNVLPQDMRGLWRARRAIRRKPSLRAPRSSNGNAGSPGLRNIERIELGGGSSNLVSASESRTRIQER